MQSSAEDRYHRAVTELGARKLWYQTGSDLLYAAVVAGVDDVAPSEILTRSEALAEILPRSHDLHLVRSTVAAVSGACGIGVESFIATADGLAETLRAATRSKRARRVAGAVGAARGSRDISADHIVALHEKWNERHRLITTSLDIILATITEAAGVDPAIAGSRADEAVSRLADESYGGEWEVARILAIESPSMSAERFLHLAAELRGRRRKPLTDRRHTIAIAALADHTPVTLTDLMRHRIRALRVGRFRPDSSTAVTLAALLTLGDSVSRESRLRTAFHGFVLREHYTASYREAMSD